MIELTSPTQAALFLVRNLAQLNTAQVYEIEKAVAAALPDQRVAGMTLRNPCVAACYGCRILKSIEKMKDLEKISDRWSLAWCGTDNGKIPGVLTLGDEAWIHECKECWESFLLDRINQLQEQDPSLDSELAIATFYPEIRVAP